MYTGQADELARKIEQSSKILEIDETTGETILHELAKEGKVEILKLLLSNEKIASNMVSYLLWPDKIGWTPVMSATKAGMVFSSTLRRSTSKLGMEPWLEPEPENLSFSSKYGTRVFKIKTREPGFWICITNLNILVWH